MRRLIFMLTAAALMAAALMTAGAAPATAQLTEEERADLREAFEVFGLQADRLGVEEGDVVPEAFFSGTEITLDGEDYYMGIDWEGLLDDSGEFDFVAD